MQQGHKLDELNKGVSELAVMYRSQLLFPPDGVDAQAFVELTIGAMLALGAARTAAQSAATVASGPRAQAKAERETDARRNTGPTQADRDRAAESTDTAWASACGPRPR